VSDGPQPNGFRLAPWLAGYDRRTLRKDLVAGLTVGIVLIPQSMAYALLAGVPPIYGLYASLVPLLVYALLGTSGQLAVGVIAIDMLVVHAGLSSMAPAASADYVELAILLALMVGVTQLFMAVTRMGFVANLLSRPVMAGFTAGAAVIIAVSQLAGLAGFETQGGTALPELVSQLLRHGEEVRLLPLVVGCASIAAILGLRHWAPRIPPVLVVVVLGTALTWLLGLEARGLPLIGDVPRGIPAFTLPPLEPGVIRSLVPTALALALLQFITVASLGKVFAARRGESIQPNRELLAIGVANVAGGLFRALPVSGSFSRTALAEQAGSETPAANLVAATLVVVGLLVLTPVLGFVPVALLSAIIVVAALGLLDIQEIRFLLRAKSVDGWIAIGTFVSTAFFGILNGIFVGVAASVLAILYRISRPNAAVLGHLPGTRSFRDVRHSEEAQSVEGILMLRVDASFSFMNAEYLKEVILKHTAPGASGIEAIVVDASSINDLDTTAATVLLNVKKTLDEEGIELYFGGVKEPMRDVLAQTGLLEILGEDSVFLSPHRAVTHILQKRGEPESYLQNVPGGIEHPPDPDIEVPGTKEGTSSAGSHASADDAM